MSSILQGCLLYIFIICISTLEASSVAPQTTIKFDTKTNAICDWFGENAGQGSFMFELVLKTEEKKNIHVRQ